MDAWILLRLDEIKASSWKASGEDKVLLRKLMRTLIYNRDELKSALIRWFDGGGQDATFQSTRK